VGDLPENEKWDLRAECRSYRPSSKRSRSFHAPRSGYSRKTWGEHGTPPSAKASLIDFRFHDLRHSAASRLVQSGANLSEVAQLLGHKDIRMTQRYSHVHNEHTRALVDRVIEGIA
jgi:integrase